MANSIGMIFLLPSCVMPLQNSLYIFHKGVMSICNIDLQYLKASKHKGKLQKNDLWKTLVSPNNQWCLIATMASSLFWNYMPICNSLSLRFLMCCHIIRSSWGILVWILLLNQVPSYVLDDQRPASTFVHFVWCHLPNYNLLNQDFQRLPHYSPCSYNQHGHLTRHPIPTEFIFIIIMGGSHSNI